MGLLGQSELWSLTGRKEEHWSLGSDWQPSPDDSKVTHWMDW